MTLNNLLAPTLTALIESTLNRVVYGDDALKLARQRLQDKTLILSLKELPFPLVFAFAQQGVDVYAHDALDADCHLSLSLNTARQLRDRQLLPQLIREEKVVLQGDIQVVQHFAALLDLSEFEFADFLAPYCGDLAAQAATTLFSKGKSVLSHLVNTTQRGVSDAIKYELNLMPAPLQLAWFNDEVTALTQDVTALMTRLDTLERR